MTIEVTCDCGRVYVLPAGKEGRKLQCRRCGSVSLVRRDADPGTIVPFEAPLEEVDEVTPPLHRGASPTPSSGPRRPPAETVLDAQGQLRRCPQCGLQDEPAVTVCIRCRYDWTLQRGAKPPTRESSGQDRPERAVLGDLARVERLARLSLVPVLGAVAAIGAFAVSLQAGRTLSSLMIPELKQRLRARLSAARMLAGGSLLGWIGLIAWMALIHLPGEGARERNEVGSRCRDHLAQVGRCVLASVHKNGRFPAEKDRTFSEGLDDLVTRRELGPDILLCPVIGAERYGRDAVSSPIDASSDPAHILLWDTEGHPSELGLRTFRALRVDGRVDEFASYADLEAARTRSSSGTAPRPPSQDVGREREGRTTPPSPAQHGPTTFEALRGKVIQADKELAPDATLTADDFARRIGLSPGDVVGPVAGRDDDVLKRATMRLIARLANVPAGEMLLLTRPFERTADLQLRLALACALERAGAAEWLEQTATVVDDALPPLKDEALAHLSGEALKDAGGLRRVLLLARDRRLRTQPTADQPIFVLPPGTYADAAKLVADPEVGPEAVALLCRGTAEVVQAIDPIFASPSVPNRRAAFHVLRTNLIWRDQPLGPFHEKLRSERDRAVEASALSLLLATLDVETLRRALEVLREGGPNDELGDVVHKILRSVRGKDVALELVAELEHPGPARDEVMKELSRGPRIVDDTIGQALAERMPRVDSVEAQTMALQLAAARYDGPAQQWLISCVAQARTAALRERAIASLCEHPENLVESERASAKTSLANRALKEGDPGARERVMSSLERWEFKGPAATATLEQLLRRRDEPVSVRERVVRCLESQNDPRVVSILVEALDDLPDVVRQVALPSLRRLTGNPGLTPTGVSYLATVDWRKIAAGAADDVRKQLREREERESAAFAERRKVALARLESYRAESLKGP